MDESSKKGKVSVITRRQFIAGTGTLVAGGLVGPIAGRGVSAKEILVEEEMPATIPPSGHLVVYPEKCVGCEECMLVCSLFHTGECGPGLARIRIVKGCHQEVCRQCIAPECLVVCPVEAIGIDSKTGARVIDEDECMGCKKCVEACQFGMISFNEEKETAFKCDLCGGDPRCVKHCPMGAIEYVKVDRGGD